MNVSLDINELESLWRRYRLLLFRVSSPRRHVMGGRRSLEDSLRLATLSREASRLFYEVVQWDQKERVLRVKT